MDMITLKDCIEFVNKQCEEAGVEPCDIKVTAVQRDDGAGIWLDSVEFCVTQHKGKEKIRYYWEPADVTISNPGSNTTRYEYSIPGNKE
jgi:hypothetical protein